MIERADIYSVDLEPTKGHEQEGTRPVLVLSNREHNRRFPAVVAPITGGGATARVAGFTVPLTGYGLRTDGVVLAHQVRAIDLINRKGRRIESAPAELADAVVEILGLIVS